MSHKKLNQKSCMPCHEGKAPLQEEAIRTHMKELQSGWEVIGNHHLEKMFSFKDFKDALSFTNKIGSIAEKEGHHPDIHLSYGKVKIQLWTHKVNGLSESDFILAAKCDEINAR